MRGKRTESAEVSGTLTASDQGARSAPERAAEPSGLLSGRACDNHWNENLR